MKEERKVIEPNAIIVFDRTVEASELKALIEDFQGDVIITGDLNIDECLQLKCNLYVLGSIQWAECRAIDIEGDLYCYGCIDCFGIFVSGCLCSDAWIDSEDIKVGENLSCNDIIEANGYKVIVAGDLECRGIAAGAVECLGEICIDGSMTVPSGIICYGY